MSYDITLQINEGKNRIIYRTIGGGLLLQGKTQEFKEIKEPTNKQTKSNNNNKNIQTKEQK